MGKTRGRGGGVTGTVGWWGAIQSLGDWEKGVVSEFVVKGSTGRVSWVVLGMVSLGFGEAYCYWSKGDIVFCCCMRTISVIG